MNDHRDNPNRFFGVKSGRWGAHPRLLPDSVPGVKQKIRQRRPHFTPDWNSTTPDAGEAWSELFAHQFIAVARRANHLPDKLMLEYLNLAGIKTFPPRPAAGIVRFEVSEAALQSVSIGSGFQVGANPANEEQQIVVFETQQSLMATPAKIALLQHQDNRDLTPANQPNGRYLPFGNDPRVGDAWLIGLELPESAKITGSINLALWMVDAPGHLRPVSSAATNVESRSSAVTQWQGAYGGAFQDLRVKFDETAGLSQSGIIQLELAKPLTISPLPAQDQKLAWIRLQLVGGRFQRPPVFSYVELNSVRVLAVETIREEALSPEDPRDGRIYRLSRAPVNARPESLEIVSREPAMDDDQMTDQPLTRTWSLVENLDEAGPDDDVFTLDPRKGTLTFGDGIRGAKPPVEFRSLQAKRYQVLRGNASAVGGQEINTLLNTVPFVTAVSNTFPVSGGSDANTTNDRVRRGPLLIRAGQRAVASADYGLSAEDAAGANVSRVHAIPGYHPDYRGKRIPGVVGVLVVANRKDNGRPLPDEATLRAVAQHLVQKDIAPAGIEVVAAAPRFRKLNARIRFLPLEGTDLAKTQTAIEQRLNQFLDPVSGGTQQTGWPFGGTLKHSELTHRLMTDGAGATLVRSITVQLFLDDVLQPACRDLEIQEDELFWPTGHQIVPISARERS